MSPHAIYAKAAALVESDSLHDHALLALEAVLSRPLVLAALDLIDRSTVMRCVGPARHHYQVFGSTASYQVFLDLPGPSPAYCTCPAFSYLMLSSDSHLMCKHILAVLVGRGLGRVIDRPLSAEELATMLLQEYA